MIFKNINSNDIPGLIICSEPPISSSPIRIEETTIDGRDGTIVEIQGYKSYVKSVEIGLKANTNVDTVLSYFSGEGDLIFNNESDKVYKAAIYDQINLEKLLRLKKATVQFYCQPFKYNRNDNFVIVNENISNIGNILSKPIIRLEKSTGDSIELTLGGTRFKYTFSENDTYVEIDCEEKTAVYEGLNRNRNLEIGYKFPVLQPGNNAIIIHNGSAIIKAKRKDRWL